LPSKRCQQIYESFDTFEEFSLIEVDESAVGELIFFAEHTADRSRPSAGGDAFFFTLDCPVSYIVGERIERVLGHLEWIPVLGPLAEPGAAGTAAQRRFRAAQRFALAAEAAALMHVPLVEPRAFPADGRAAARVAAFASDRGQGGGFARAAARLAFCGGFDLARHGVLAEAAAASGLPPEEALAVADDSSYDLRIDATVRGLKMRGVTAPPAIRIDGNWFEGVDAVMQAAAFQAMRFAQGAPSAPCS
jgi:2-hydroxychromene-2-carboxylate isomerase